MKALVLLVFGFFALNAAADPVVKTYVSIKDGDCKLIVNEPDQAEYTKSQCGSVGSYTVNVETGDGRSWASVDKDGQPLSTDWFMDFQFVLGGPFPYLKSGVVELRGLTKEEPYALIVRVAGNEIDKDGNDVRKESEKLAIFKIGPTEACLIGSIDARQERANEKAAEIADMEAPDFLCPKE